MGKPSPSSSSASLRGDADAVSLHTQPGDRYLDDDAPELQVDDLPPVYSDHDNGHAVDVSRPDLPPSQRADLFLAPSFEDANTGTAYFLNTLLDTEPNMLESQIRFWSIQPPRPFVKVRGTHQETVDNKGKKERKAVTDFDLQIELTPYLFSDATNKICWSELRTVDNGEKTRRGTILKRRAPGANQSIEVGWDAKPTMLEWCHLYCASHAGLKTFAFRRRVVGLDEEAIKQKVEGLVRRTNYRGHLAVTFPVKDELVEVYNNCRTNRWRLTAWIQWLTFLTLTFLFTWPYLFFRTKRFEVAVADWPFSRAGEGGRKEYVSISEEQWFNLWGRALNKAVLEKRQGTLDQQDLVAAEGAEPTFNTGHAAVDGAMGFLRAGVNAMNQVNRQLGWGADC